MKKLYLIDVSSMFFRAFYAIRTLSNPAGMPTNAIYGFLSMTIKLLREIKPDYMAFCFDRAEPSFRKEIDPRYKANRSDMPEDLVPQVPYIRKLSHALGISCLDRQGYEADDLIGTLTRFGREHDLEVVIVSGDKDFGQLVGPFVSMYDTMKDVRYDEAGVLEKWGVEPRKVLDYLALVGDSSDNVPGVRGIGPKGAQKLLTEFESIEDIYRHLDKVTNKTVQKKLEEGKDEAFLSKKLIRIVCDVDLGIGIDDLKLKPIVRTELNDLLLELDFKTFARTLLGDVAESTVHARVNPTQDLAEKALPLPGKSFVKPALKTPQSAKSQVEVDRTFPSITEKQMDQSELSQWLKLEAETWGLQTERGVFIAQDSTIVQVAGSPEEMGSMLSSKKLKWKGCDLKSFWKHNFIQEPEAAWDQTLAAYIVRAGPTDNIGSLFSFYNGESLPDLPTPAQLLLAHWKLEANLRRKVESISADKVLYEIELPLVPVLLKMEQNGILIDSNLLLQQGQSLAKDIERLEKEIIQDAGETFNVASTKQLARILFEKLKMPSGKKTKTGFSTDNDVLQKLSGEFPIAGKVLQFRELSKLKSTYVDALPAIANKTSGRVHTTFNQAMTTTGRLSSTNPNLQNIPIRTERGNLIRRAFIADQGYDLVSADYSQIELRILAHITGDEGLVRAFADNLDIHTATASEVFEVGLKEVTPEMRRKAKAVNFGLAYGQGAFGLAEVLKISRSEATAIINRYFTRFRGVRDYMTDTVETAKKVGYVETLFGRRRYLDELSSKSPMLRKFGERAAINAPIQGTASDLVKKAMITVAKEIPSKMLLQVHDELVFETSEGVTESVKEEVRKTMQSVAQLRVPLDVNVGVGKNWDDAHS